MLVDGPERVSVTEQGVHRPRGAGGVLTLNPAGPGSVPNPKAILNQVFVAVRFRPVQEAHGDSALTR